MDINAQSKCTSSWAHAHTYAAHAHAHAAHAHAHAAHAHTHATHCTRPSSVMRRSQTHWQNNNLIEHFDFLSTFLIFFLN